MYLHISPSLSLSNHPWISQNENCILVNSSLPLIRDFWDPLISLFWSPQHKYGFPSKHLTSSVTEYLLVLWGVSLPQGGGGGGQSTIIVFWPGVTLPWGSKYYLTPVWCLPVPLSANLAWHQIPRIHKAAKYRFWVITWLLNLTGASTAMLQGPVTIFRAVWSC